jgi:hypothetical protein
MAQLDEVEIAQALLECGRICGSEPTRAMTLMIDIVKSLHERIVELQSTYEDDD